MSKLGLEDSHTKIDLSVIRGLEYYTGPVFEAELLSEIKDAKGRPVQIGSIASGGRYDDLVKRFKGIEVPAVGISVGVSRLLAALALTQAGASDASGPVVILALDKDRMADYQLMAQELRGAGVRAEVYLGGSGMKAQMKYADKRNASVTIIQGSDELERGEITLKDLILGSKLSREITDNAQWREGQPAQFSVPRDGLTKAVLEVLARHK